MCGCTDETLALLRLCSCLWPRQVRARLLADAEEAEARRLTCAILDCQTQRIARKLRAFDALDAAVAQEALAQDVRMRYEEPVLAESCCAWTLAGTARVLTVSVSCMQ